LVEFFLTSKLALKVNIFHQDALKVDISVKIRFLNESNASAARFKVKIFYLKSHSVRCNCLLFNTEKAVQLSSRPSALVDCFYYPILFSHFSSARLPKVDFKSFSH
jgi:hypothetical protein